LGGQKDKLMIKHIYLILSSPRIMIISWICFIIAPSLGIIRLQILNSNSLRVFRVSGLSTILFYVPFVISAFVLSIMLFWFREFSRGKLKQSHQKSFSFISILTIVFLFVSQYLINLEFKFYPNYLYQHYGITIAQLKLMSFIAALQIMIFLAFLVYRSTYDKAKKLLSYNPGNKKGEVDTLNNASFFVSLVGILSLFILSGGTLLNWNVLMSESKEGYEGKVGIDYKYIKLIVDNTSSDVMVIHPPQGDKWPAIGNQPVLRYFLYPRTLVSGTLVEDQKYVENIDGSYFVLIDPNGNREWPVINFEKKSIAFNESSFVNYKSLDMIFSNEVSKIYKIKFR